MPRRLPGRAIQAGTITVTQLETSVATTVQTGGGPKITTVQVTSNSYVVLDDTAVDIAGGYIKITGTGFAAGCQVLINNTPATSTTFIGPTEVRAQLPATAAGTYMLYLINADGGVAIRVNGVTFSATPSWVTASDLTSYALGDAISIQLSATGASTFALAAGSTLPTGLTLSAGGLLSGSVTGLENDTSYSFTITATDAENQDSPRTFTITITVQLQVSRSLRFNAADTTSLSWIPSNTGNLQTFTISCWIKRSAITGTGNPILVAGTDANDYFYINLTNTDTLSIVTGEAGTANANNVATSAVFRDTGSWYHMVINIDFSNATSTDRIRAYVNGTRQTLTGTFAAASFTGTRHNRAGITHYIGRWMNGSPYFSGYITEFYFIDGQALTPAAFAETNTTTGQYIPKKYTGTYGTNGFYLPFTDNSSVANLGRNYQPLTADPFWDRTVLLLNGTGTNNANNNTFTDSSTNAFAITRNGNVSQGRFSPFTQGGWSNYFDGTGDYLTLSDNAAFAFGSGAVTIETWAYFNTSISSFVTLLAQSDNASAAGSSFIFVVDTTGKVNFEFYYGSSTITLADPDTVPINQWVHLAVSRNTSNTISLYINGNRKATNTSFSASVNDSSQTVSLGGRNTGIQPLNGYLSNSRIVKGTAVYDPTLATLTVPTTPLTAITNTSLLTCHANRFLDSSTNNFVITRNGDARVVAFSPFTPTTAYSAVTHGGSAYFDGTGDYLTVSDNANLEPLGGNFTIEAWFYLNAVTTGTQICGKSWWTPFYIEGTNLVTYLSSNGSTWDIASNQVIITSVATFRWYHVAMVRNGTSIKAYVNGTETLSLTSSAALHDGSDTLTIGSRGTTYLNGYIADIRFVKGTAVYTANFTPPTAPVTAIANTQLLLNFVNAGIQDATGDTNIETVGDAKISTAQSKWAGSSMLFDGTGDWLQLPASDVYAFGSGDYTVEAWVYFTSINNTNLQIIFGSGAAGGNSFFFSVDVDQISVGTSAAYISNQATTFTTGQWYHVVACRSGTTLRLFVNGTQAGSNVTDTTNWTSSGNARVGANSIGTQTVFGYIQDLRITRAARYTGNFTPPTAQFAYNQGDINYNQWVPTNFSVTAGAGNDSLLDVPTNWGVDTGLGGEVRGNYCTLNPNIPPKNSGTASRTLANGNLDLAGVSGGWTVAGGTFRIFAGSGRWYFETTGGVANSTVVGFHKLTRGYFLDAILGYTDGADTEGYAYAMDGNKLNNGVSAYGASWTTSDVIGCAIDASGATASITFYKNGVSQGVAFSNLTGDFIPAVSIGGTGPVVCNFGQRPFAYAAPAGFKCMNTHNLPALAVTKSNTAFDTVLYTGTGSALTVGGYNFAPDIVWYKSRSSGVYYHGVFDTVRGATKFLSTNDTGVEVTDAARLSAFTANGFTTGTDVGVNTSGANMVAWAWDSGTDTVVNTAGTLQSNVRVNTTAGISIQTWTAVSGTPSIGHGLNAVPKFIIIKRRSSAQDWYVYHSAFGNNNDYVLLSSAAGKATYSALWGTGHTTTTFSFSASPGDHVSYCFAEIPGFSSFSSWTGNGSADGPFIYTGFRPAMILAKQINTAGQNWYILDSDRSPSNVLNRRLYPNLTNSEDSDGNINCDLLSNGFKLRDAYTGWNASGGTYIYAAFAESPFKYARAR